TSVHARRKRAAYDSPRNSWGGLPKVAGPARYGMMMRGESGCPAGEAWPAALPGAAMAPGAALLRRGKRARRNSKKARERGRLLDSALFMRRRKTKSWKISESLSGVKPAGSE